MSILIFAIFLFLLPTAHATETVVNALVPIPKIYMCDVSGCDLDAGFEEDVLDGASEEHALIFQVPKTGTIDRVRFVTDTVTTGCDVDVRMETVSTTDADPTGTLLCANSNATQTIDDTDDNTVFTTDVGDGCAVTVGDIVAVTVVNPAASFCNMQLTTRNEEGNTASFPYMDFFTGSWAKQRNYPPVTLVGYDDGTYAPMDAYAVDGNEFQAILFDSADDPDEIALFFQLPVPVRVAGFWALLDYETAGDYDVVLYDSDGTTALQTLSVDVSGVHDANDLVVVMRFPGSSSLSADTNYRLTIKPTDATGRIQLWYFDSDTAVVLDAMDGGQEFHWSQRVNAGGWTETTTRRPMIGILIDAFDDGAGGGGGAGGVWGF